MWVIRFLSGPLAGKTKVLKPGKNTLGRAPVCDIQVADNGVSKIHLELLALEDKVIVTDMESSNGTFINGVRVQSRKVAPDDKIAMYQVLFDVHLAPQHVVQAMQAKQQQMNSPQMQQQQYAQPQMDDMNQAYQGGDQQYQTDDSGAAPHKPPPKTFGEFTQHYIDTVLLPGVYKLPELFEFRIVLAGFVVAFIFLVTSLSVIPMIQISKSSIQKESRRRALGIAKNLAKRNEEFLLRGLNSSISTQEARLEEGVNAAMIVSHSDGHIIAPVNKAGEYADIKFAHNARRETKDHVKQIDDTTIGASIPIAFYNAEMGTQQIIAHAVILYDMGSLAIDEGRTISLFMQTLTIAIIIGAILYFFLIRLIEFPIRDINRQMDIALKDGTENIEVKYLFPALKTLADNVTSALSRAAGGGGGGGGDGFGGMMGGADRDIEAENILRIIGCPALAVNATDNMVVAVNEQFEQETGVNLQALKSQGLEAIPDQAFQLSLSDLLERAQQQPSNIASNTLEIGGVNYDLNAQTVMGNGQPAYYIVTILSQMNFDGEVA